MYFVRVGVGLGSPVCVCVRAVRENSIFPLCHTIAH